MRWGARGRDGSLTGEKPAKSLQGTSRKPAEEADLLIRKAEKLGVSDSLIVHRLSLEQGKLSSVSYSAQEAKELREELEFDLRR